MAKTLKSRSQPLVVIAGRPNVGKSTLFNRLVGKRHAITSEEAGTTRDRLYRSCSWNRQDFVLVDTGGLDLVQKTDEIGQGIQVQAGLGIEEATVVLFVVDAQAELVAADLRAAERLRKLKQTIILVANKADSPDLRQATINLLKLGLGEPMAISSTQGTGIGDLLDRIASEVKHAKPVTTAVTRSVWDEDDMLHVAIVGKPNVGKSSLLNAFLQKDQALVSPIAGTTRDAVDTPLLFGEQVINLIDTAGIRRRGKIGVRTVEQYSVFRAKQAVERCDIAVLVIDAVQGVTKQDQHVSQIILEAHKGLVIVVNKWDLVEKNTTTMPRYIRYLQHTLDYLPWAPVVFTSATTRQRTSKILEMAIQVYEQQSKRVETATLNRLVQDAKVLHPPGTKSGKRAKIFYVTQASVRPPEFVVFVNDAKMIHFSYRRFLENRIREKFGFLGTPITLKFRSKSETGSRRAATKVRR